MAEDSNYLKCVERGFERMSALKVAICTTVRDCDVSLRRNIPFVEELRKKFKESYVVVVENDSKDNTKNLVHSWGKSDKRIYVHSENYGIRTIPTSGNEHPKSKYFSAHRIAAMAKYRNIYLAYVKQNLEVDYIIVMDLDVYNIDLKGVANSFGQELEWQAMSSNGKKLTAANIFRPYFFDTYAFQELNDNSPQSLKKILKNQKKYSRLKVGMSPIKVKSGFNAMAIYKWESIRDFSYECQKNDDPIVQYKCEHMDLHEKMRAAGWDGIYLNPSQLVRYENVGPDFYFKKIFKYLSKK